ncbi:MAG: Ldh family oxidoreductase [bacterium]|nr:Ldh family oxidoreductase [bacterium]
MTYAIEDPYNVTLYPEATLRGFSTDVLLALGASKEEADIVTDGVITASLWFHPGQGQGLEKLFRYKRRVQGGGIVPQVEMRWEQDAPAMALLNAEKGFGYVAGHRAMHRAVDKATATGIGMVGVRRSNHFGIAGYHAVQAARRGCIGWVFTNARAEMAPWGSAKPVLGTNPWGIAIPRAGHDPIVLDMALTMSGKGMMRWYERIGKPMPDTWALTPDGRTTTDPTAAMDGPMLPIGEYKGYGLSFVTDVLAGVMTGAYFGLSVFQDESLYDVGHVMLAIDPAIFLGRERFEERLERLIAEVLSSPPIDANRPVMLPGQIEHQRMAERQRDGIPVDRATVDGLRAIAKELGVPFPL